VESKYKELRNRVTIHPHTTYPTVQMTAAAAEVEIREQNQEIAATGLLKEQ